MHPNQKMNQNKEHTAKIPPDGTRSKATAKQETHKAPKRPCTKGRPSAPVVGTDKIRKIACEDLERGRPLTPTAIIDWETGARKGIVGIKCAPQGSHNGARTQTCRYRCVRVGCHVREDF